MFNVSRILRRNCVLGEQSRQNPNAIGLHDLLHQPNQLGQQEFAIPFPGRLHLVVDVPSGFKDDLLHPKLPAQFRQVDLGNPLHVGLALDHRGKLGQSSRVQGPDFQDRDLLQVQQKDRRVDVIDSNHVGPGDFILPLLRNRLDLGLVAWRRWRSALATLMGQERERASRRC